MTAGEPLRFEDPSELGAYRLLRRLGNGGMGVVYLAEDQAGKKVALKVIHPHLASHEEFRERFRSEVALARKVARFSTAPILDSDTDADPPYIVTEFIDGPTLSQVVTEQGPLSGSQLHALGVGVAGALTAIHSAGIVHRDLKPGNVPLSRFGPRVIDFGIARAADAVTGVTHNGQYVGSPSFMAPEQFKGEAVTAATDVFAWGAVMAFAGTGRQPFGKAAEAIMYKVVYGDADLDGLDPQLTDLVARALSKDPGARPTAQQVLDELVQGGRPPAELWQPTAAPSSGPPAGSESPGAGAAPVTGPRGTSDAGAWPVTGAAAGGTPGPPPAYPAASPAPGTVAPPPAWHPPGGWPVSQPVSQPVSPSRAPVSPPAPQPTPPPPPPDTPWTPLYADGPPVSGSPAGGAAPGPAPRGPVLRRLPARGSRRWVVWLLLSIFLVCCVGGGGAIGGLIYFGHSLDKGDSIAALEGYLDDVQRKRYSQAYDQLCPDSKVGLSRNSSSSASPTPRR